MEAGLVAATWSADLDDADDADDADDVAAVAAHVRASLEADIDRAIPRLVPWAQQFETAPVRYVAGQLNEQGQALVLPGRKTTP